MGLLLVAVLSVSGSEAAAQSSVLIEAIKNQNTETARVLLKGKRVDVNLRQPDGGTALHWAAHLNDVAIVELLLEAGADVNASNDLGVTPLLLACENGNASVARILLKAGSDPNARAFLTDVSPLMIAARTGNPDVVIALLAYGATVNVKEGGYHQTALMWAAANGHAEVVEALIKGGADVSARSAGRPTRAVVGNRFGGRGVANRVDGGFTPLLFTARHGHVGVARILLAAGANVNDTAPDGTSALVIAAHSGQAAIAALFLASGANPNAAGSGYTALHAAVLRGDGELVKKLLSHGANPNASLTKGTPVRRYSKEFALSEELIGATPFFLAAKFAEAGMMRTLVAAGADPLLPIADGTTSLMAATGVGAVGFLIGLNNADRRDRHMDPGEWEVLLLQDEDERRDMGSGFAAVKLALDLGIDVNAVNSDGDTALHGAALHGSKNVIRLLVERGTTLHVKNGRGQTALAVAKQRREEETAQLLRTLGAID